VKVFTDAHSRVSAFALDTLRFSLDSPTQMHVAWPYKTVCDGRMDRTDQWHKRRRFVPSHFIRQAPDVPDVAIGPTSAGSVQSTLPHSNTLIMIHFNITLPSMFRSFKVVSFL